MATSLFSLRIVRIISLVLRVMSAVTLMASLVLLVTLTQEVMLLNERGLKREYIIMRFYHVVPFRYTVATNIIGVVYSIFQIVCSIIGLAKGRDGNVTLDFYGEEVMTKLLASGAAAGFVGSAELIKGWEEANGSINGQFMNKSYSAHGLVLLAFVCSFVLSVLSSYALTRNE